MLLKETIKIIPKFFIKIITKKSKNNPMYSVSLLYIIIILKLNFRFPIVKLLKIIIIIDNH